MKKANTLRVRVEEKSTSKKNQVKHVEEQLSKEKVDYALLVNHEKTFQVSSRL